MYRELEFLGVESMPALPLFYYPATVVWVDDDELLLQVATEILGNENKIQTFNSPGACLDFFATYIPYLKEAPLLHGRTEMDDYETINHLPVDINPAAFTQLPLKHERKNEVSVLIADYRMPDMTGIDLFRQLKGINAKKILLTGEADNAQAVAAFNEGIIDCFIQKNSATLVTDIAEHLNILANEYFFELSKALLAHLEVDGKIHLSDPSFIGFFKDLCKENDIQEHYIFDKQGNMQLIDAQGTKSYFVVHTNKTLNAFIELYQDKQDASNLIDAVKKRKMVPFFGVGLEGWQCKAEDWLNHFYTPQLLEGREKYYWFRKEIS